MPSSKISLQAMKLKFILVFYFRPILAFYGEYTNLVFSQEYLIMEWKWYYTKLNARKSLLLSVWKVNFSVTDIFLWIWFDEMRKFWDIRRIRFKSWITYSKADIKCGDIAKTIVSNHFLEILHNIRVFHQPYTMGIKCHYMSGTECIIPNSNLLCESFSDFLCKS